MKLTQIDDSIIGDHTFISTDDKCFFASNYTAYEGFSYSGTNQLIYNFKIKPDRKGTYQWNHKVSAIKEIGQMFKTNLSEQLLEKVTIVPIPPSKCKSDPLYDDRLTQSLNHAFGTKADIRELLIQIESKVASHLTDDRPTINQLYNNLKIDDSKTKDLKTNIILVDDVITTGAHFIASKRRLLEKFPKINILGVFVARREFKED